jgi:hypothetical protein
MADAGRPIAPWISNPHRLVGWWDMLVFSASDWFRLALELECLQTDCYMRSFPDTAQRDENMLSRPVDDAIVEKALHILRALEKCEPFGMPVSAATAKDMADELAANRRRSWSWLMWGASNLKKIIVREANTARFWYIPPERIRYAFLADSNQPFGEKVSDAFPSSNPESYEAAGCIACERSTAAVFHLMRAMEIALAILGKEFGVSLEKNSWGPAIDQIESKVRRMHETAPWKDMPDCKELQRFYSQAIGHLGIAKDAWRNYTMHNIGKYTTEEAEKIFAGVQWFMERLAEKLKE